jgi:O-acetyl-ADP-ribose deacetylase
MPLGAAVVTTAGKLPHKAIIHVAGINLLWRASESSIRASTRNALRLATDLGFQSIAFPLIGAGSGGRSIDFSFATMNDALARCAFDGSVSIVRWGS